MNIYIKIRLEYRMKCFIIQKDDYTKNIHYICTY